MRARRPAGGIPLLVACGLACVAAPWPAHAAPTPSFPNAPLGDESVAATDDAGAFLTNPAAGGLRYPTQLLLVLGGPTPDPTGVLGAGSSGGFGVWAGRWPEHEQQYGLGFGGGPDPLRLGVHTALRVSETTGEHVWDMRLGALARPSPWLSLGGTLAHPGQPSFEGARLRREYTLGVGVRPIAWSRERAYEWGPRLTLTADVLMSEGADVSQARTRFAAEIEVLPGIALRGTLEDHGRAQIAISMLGPGWGVLLHRAPAASGQPELGQVALTVHHGEDRTVLATPADRRVARVSVSGLLADEDTGGLSLLGGSGTTRVAPIHAALERALEDPLTRGVLLELDGATGMAQLEELRPRLARLRAAGKPVVAYLEAGGGRGDLYLASACDRVVATEEAQFSALGLRVEKRYWRRFLADLGVRVDRASVGRYKSAYREYSVDSLPPADRESIEHQLDQVQEQFVSTVSADRHMDRARLESLLDGRQWPSEELVRAGLIDTVGYRDDALALLGARVGLGSHPRVVDPDAHPPARRAWTVPGRVAVVYAGGVIDVGESGNDLLEGPMLGSDTFTRQLDHAFETPGVEAVVLRVDSPGGSVAASNLMLHAVEEATRRHHRPLVVSMAGTAASGGYYIAMAGKPILADHMTRTGSIGVVFTKPSFEGFYTRHHVREDDLQRGDAMAGLSAARDWDAAMQASADSAITRSYRRFVDKVARARGLASGAADSVAQGRVWLGDDAVRLGLVDRIGGLEDAVMVARHAAGIPDGERIRPVEFRRPGPTLVERLAGSLVRDTWTRSLGIREPGGLEYRMDDDLAP
ncbi:MAG: S49 family peptidase [Candidatus Eisenbacteria bacterium]